MYMAEVLENLKCDFRNQAIASIDTTKTALDYHEITIDLTGSANQQKLVDLAQYGVAYKSAYARALAPYYRVFTSALASVYVREGVAEKLSDVNRILKAYGCEVLALDGYRPIALQDELWNHFIEKGRQILPGSSEEELVAFAGLYCSDPRRFNPTNYRTWPIHNTGGAIDLTLRSLADSQELYMGGIFDDADEISWTRYYEDPQKTSQSALEARRNRRLLFHSMGAAGFANYHCEWWHFDLGTQMWVINGGHQGHAWYGRAELTI
jgi:D-alanyl-D-alanine dipeptidase